jgi:iron complex transport system permease protein
VSVLTYFSTAEQLQRFTFWSMGNLANMSWEQVLQLALWVCSGTFLAFLVNKPLDALLLGENYAKSMGVNISKTRWIIIFSSSILAGSITALVGPIAFVGLAVPHIAKLMFHTSNHKVLFFATFLLGSLSMLICDTISQLPGQSFMIPINAITSLFGAPIVIYLLIHKNRTW